ncbi:hypothetical protein SRB5_68650 [Streptomyces sp. RB5]|uniref:Uncharacterized protein n=1 Tax=Streptomyces smaragdinus TaxID=2585196 RepID=A0A7K0CTI3_9ACTN|nr:hypothetical protein [Streptomyces smaragdinus]MQY16663.1 hypothetical protein [Streptomyces smaragdinus]
MVDGHILGRGARWFGSFACALLALLSLVWIGRDLTVTGSLPDLWWSWTGLPADRPDGVLVSSLYDPVLVVVYAVAAATAIRSSAAAGILGCAAVVTVALRVPGLWALNEDWLRAPGGLDSELRNQALLSAGAAATLATVLLISVAAARRPADADTGYGLLSPEERPPPAPGDAAAFVASFFLWVAAVGIGGWTVYDAVDTGWSAYWHQLTGEGTLGSLLQPPPAYGKWFTVGLCLTAAVGALLRAPLSRPMGMTASALVLGLGGADTARQLRAKVFEDFGALPTDRALSVITALVLLLAGFAALWALAGRAPEDPMAQPLTGWRESGSAPPNW